MTLPKSNPRIPEGINASQDNPLVEFAWLAATVLLGIAGLVVALSFSMRLLAPHIPFSWEQRASGPVALYVKEDAEGPAHIVAARVALQALAQGLLESSLSISVDGESPADSVPQDAYRFHLMPGEMPNAFATLGANIMVTEALLAAVGSENGLAMVIAHEIAHVQLRHPIESLGRGLAIQLVLSVVLGADNNTLSGVLSSGGTLTLLSFSRDMELEADARALEILRRHYGHVGGADEFFRAMDAAQDSAAWLEFTSTHPDTDRRLELIHGAMRQDGAHSALRQLPVDLQHLPAPAVCAEVPDEQSVVACADTPGAE